MTDDTEVKPLQTKAWLSCEMKLHEPANGNAKHPSPSTTGHVRVTECLRFQTDNPFHNLKLGTLRNLATFRPKQKSADWLVSDTLNKWASSKKVHGLSPEVPLERGEWGNLSDHFHLFGHFRDPSGLSHLKHGWRIMGRHPSGHGTLGIYNPSSQTPHT